jgi:ubiquinone/menaquinone biosynthesis C-methylase UbiE
VLTRAEARTFYDRWGARQDSQRPFEEPALRDLVAHARFDAARAVFELGCGTGRFAETLLEHHLPPGASYRAVDLSTTMVDLARKRLARFGARAEVQATDGEPVLALPSGSVDRFVSTYVFDLLGEDEIRALLAEAHRVLEPGGLVCLAGLTHGTGLVSRAFERVWRALHALRPSLVGGCRPISLVGLLSSPQWRILHHRVVVAWGMPSEVVVAEKRSA